MKLSSRAEQILIGSLLGDGCLVKVTKGSNPYFIERHAVKQRNYLLWKNDFLKFRIFYNDYDGYKTIGLKSYCEPFLKDYYILVYPYGKKVVTREILDKLEPLGVMVWFCDDGSYNYRGNFAELSTFGFGYEGNLIIKGWFEREYNINFNIFRDKRRNINHQYSLKLNCKETKKFIDLIKSYMPNCMSYKLGLNKRKLDLSTLKRIEYTKQYIKREPLRWKKYKKDYDIRNESKIKQWHQQYYKLNKERLLIYEKMYRLTKKIKSNKEKVFLWRYTLKKLRLKYKLIQTQKSK